ncbi:MAG: TonB-dependent receptor [Proteobacteria bacterium]|nr:TonB-dependent receptor [Pseudomonadota bacterium]
MRNKIAGRLRPRLSVASARQVGAHRVHEQPIPIAAAVSFILANTPTAFAQETPTAGADVSSKVESIQEVTVTAQRRSQTVQDIPYNITAMTGDDLERSGTTSFNQLEHIVPGLLTVDAGPAARGNTNDFTLRGLRTDGPGGAGDNGTDIPSQSVSSVSTYFGETPVFFPIALYDIERIEVLRGPQGTLYGSGAEAGTIRFIPSRPQFDAFRGSVGASSGVTAHAGGNASGQADGVFNVPLSSQLALRVVTGFEHLPGFINQVDLWQRQGSGYLAPATRSVAGDIYSGPVLLPPRRGTNSSNQVYARAALRWQPAERWDLQLDYLHQNTKVNDVQTSNPQFPGGVIDLGVAGNFPNSAFVARPGGRYEATNAALQPYADTINLGSAVATADFGFATFTSASSFYQNESYAATDVIGNFVVPAGTNFLALPYYANYPRALALETTPVDENSFTQEFRLVSKQSGLLDYVVGAFYRNQRVSSDTHQVLPGITQYRNDIGTPQAYQGLPDLIYGYDRRTRFVDRAVFGELTLHPTASWQVTGGARFFWQSFDNTTTELLPVCGAPCAADGVDPTGLNQTTAQTKVTDHIFKLNTSYDLSPHAKVYVTFSQGFRPGGANAIPTTGVFASLPAYQTFRPDFAKNYEIGFKGTTWDQRVRFSADAFVIKLTDFQFAFSTLSGIPATFNGSNAQSKGTELELRARLTTRLDVSFGHTYTDATVKDPVRLSDLGFCGTPLCPLTALPSGARLPGVPKNTLTAAVDYKVPLTSGPANNWFVALHADAAYRDESGSVIDPTSRSYWVIPSSTLVNASLSLLRGSAWRYELFANNLTDAAGYTGGRGTAQDPATLRPLPNLTATRAVTRPRTIGLRIRFDF